VGAAERVHEPDADGWTRLRIRVDWGLNEAAEHLVGMGRHLEVIGPPEVRDQVVKLARGVLERHPVG
jgi:hypothetical protein